MHWTDVHMHGSRTCWLIVPSFHGSGARVDETYGRWARKCGGTVDDGSSDKDTQCRIAAEERGIKGRVKKRSRQRSNPQAAMPWARTVTIGSS